MKKLACLILVLTSIGVFAHEKQEKITNKGKLFFFWGWNWGYYSDSDISFKGDDYDFKLNDATASDRQTPFSFDQYFNPANITIPQTNFRIGYFIKENYSLSIGVDHMKYVLDQDQMASVTGEINGSYDYDGTYNGELVEITDEFLKFEHTDGLNYINVEFSRFDDVSSIFNLHSENFQVNLTEGVGAGFLLPKTNSTLLGKERHDDFHLSGWGVSARVGLDLTFYKHFFIMSELKGGYINMRDIKTTKSESDSASQHFGFISPTIVFGGKFKIF